MIENIFMLVGWRATVSKLVWYASRTVYKLVRYASTTVYKLVFYTIACKLLLTREP